MAVAWKEFMHERESDHETSVTKSEYTTDSFNFQTNQQDGQFYQERTLEYHTNCSIYTYLSISSVVPSTKATIVVANGIELVDMRLPKCILRCNILA